MVIYLLTEFYEKYVIVYNLLKNLEVLNSKTMLYNNGSLCSGSLHSFIALCTITHIFLLYVWHGQSIVFPEFRVSKYSTVQERLELSFLSSPHPHPYTPPPSPPFLNMPGTSCTHWHGLYIVIPLYTLKL